MNIDESKTPEEPVSVVAVPNKGGRPSKYTPETVEKLLAAIADGLTIRQSCLAAGIGEQTVRDWQERYPDLESRLAEAREQARQKALACIKAAGEAGDWRAAEAFLRLSFHQDYRRDSNINVTAQTCVQLVCDEETRQRIMALRAKILGPKKAEAIEVETQPSGLLSPIETVSQTEPVESEAERAMREKLNDNIAKGTAYQEPEPGCYVEPWGDGNHPAIKSLGLGPK
jgi:hypothetical protein